MTQLEKLKAWLLTYPQWEAGQLLYIDYTDGVPGCAGLFPKGVEEVENRQDILGNRRVRCRLRAALYRLCGGEEDQTAQAQWLLGFQQWVRNQSAQGLAPRLGDGTEPEWIRAEEGARKESRTGMGVYAVVLTAEFTKYYQGD